jgi:hypothetical protein
MTLTKHYEITVWRINIQGIRYNFKDYTYSPTGFERWEGEPKIKECVTDFLSEFPQQPGERTTVELREYWEVVV